MIVERSRSREEPDRAGMVRARLLVLVENQVLETVHCLEGRVERQSVGHRVQSQEMSRAAV